MNAVRGSRWGAAAYVVVLVVCALLAFVWLVIGAVVEMVAQVPRIGSGLEASAGGGDLWARGLLEAVARSEPLDQAVLDYTFSLLNVVIAVALLVSRRRNWSIRLLVVAMISSAGAFNLQAHAVATVVQTATGLGIGGLHQVLLHGVAVAAYILALMVFPSNPDARPGSPAVHVVVVAAGGAIVLVVGFGTALLPQTTSCVLFFGFLVPLVGLAALSHRIRRATSAEERTQARLLYSVLVAAAAVAIVFVIVTLLLSGIGWTGLTLLDPTAPGADGKQTALLFWFSRLVCVAIAGAALVATRRAELWTAERLFSRGLVVALVAALIGCGYVLVHTITGLVDDAATHGGTVAAAALATAVAAVGFLPVYARVERLVDRLLYGSRPTPYNVLAGIAALSRSTATDAPDLARVAEGVGRGLGATTCRLTVKRPGLRDRTYSWAQPGTHVTDALAEMPVRHGEEQIGTLAVDRAAVAGLHEQRQHLLADIADSLGVVLQASRFGIELERQLRAALAHAGEIAVARREAVAEMDSERRRIERDLHDGAQHHLVSLSLALGLVEHQVSTSQFDQARHRLHQIAEQIDTADSVLAQTAAGVSSPLLSQQGLVAALHTELGTGHSPVTLDSTRLGKRRFPPDAEAAVYFCCLESVNNARKHAPGAAVRVCLTTAGGQLHFTVHDQGPGWAPDAGAGAPGRGLRNMTTRIAAVGGRVEIQSQPGAGTTVEGSVPLPPHAAAPDTAGAAPSDARPTVGAWTGTPEPALTNPILTQPTLAKPALLDQVREAIQVAGALYHGTPYAAQLRILTQRLDEPLRVAVVGAAGAGTSTLIEALVGPAPQTLPHPTRVPVWFRHSDTPSVVVHGRVRNQPATAIDAERIEVSIAAAMLTSITLIDVPGLGSVLPPVAQRARALLDPDTAVADAYVLLLRHRCPEDIELLSILHRGATSHHPAHALGVLARADEQPGIRPTEPDRAQHAAVECGAQPDVRRLCQIVVPVAGLLASAAATLRETDHQMLQWLSERADTQLAPLPRSGTAFTGTTAAPAIASGTFTASGNATAPGASPPPPTTPATLAPPAALTSAMVVATTTSSTTATPVSPGDDVSRQELLDRFGPAGIQIAIELIRSGRAPTAAALAAALTERSGLLRLRELLETQFTRRSDALKAQAVLRALHSLVRTAPPPRDARPLLYQLDRIRAGTHELTEIELVEAILAGEIDLPAPDRRAVEQLLGAAGREPQIRLGLTLDAQPHEVARAAAEQLGHWQRRASHPTSTRDIRIIAGVLLRTCEQLLAQAH